MEFPGGGAPVAGTARGSVEGLVGMFEVEEEPASEVDPAALQMVAERGGGPVFATPRGDGAEARRDLDDDAMRFTPVHWVEDQFDVGIAMLRVDGAAVDGFHAADLDVPDVTGNFAGALFIPAVTIIAGFEHRGERYSRIDLLRLGNGGAILEAVEFAGGVIGGVAIERTAVERGEVAAGSDLRRRSGRGRAGMLPKPEGEKPDDEEKGPECARRAGHFWRKRFYDE